MKTRHCLAVFALLVFAGSFSVLLAQSAPQNPALGLVAKSTGGLIGDSAVTEGSSVYSGDYLSTQDNGSLLVRIGALSLELGSSSGAHIYRAPYGAVVELNHGSLVYSTPGTQMNLVIVASDVRITPALSVPDVGKVTIEDRCRLTVYSQRGQVNVQVGSESRVVEEGKSYSVRPDNAIVYRKYLSPDESDYHKYHDHSPCEPVQMVKGHPPMAPAQSHFLLLAGVIVGTVTTIGVVKAFESPNRP
jgi:hypothetical protein